MRHLRSGYDVILPQLVTVHDRDPDPAFEEAASAAGATYVQVALLVDDHEHLQRVQGRRPTTEIEGQVQTAAIPSPGHPPLISCRSSRSHKRKCWRPVTQSRSLALRVVSGVLFASAMVACSGEEPAPGGGSSEFYPLDLDERCVEFDEGECIGRQIPASAGTTFVDPLAKITFLGSHTTRGPSGEPSNPVRLVIVSFFEVENTGSEPLPLPGRDGDGREGNEDVLAMAGIVGSEEIWRTQFDPCELAPHFPGSFEIAPGETETFAFCHAKRGAENQVGPPAVLQMELLGGEGAPLATLDADHQDISPDLVERVEAAIQRAVEAAADGSGEDDLEILRSLLADDGWASQPDGEAVPSEEFGSEGGGDIPPPPPPPPGSDTDELDTADPPSEEFGSEGGAGTGPFGSDETQEGSGESDPDELAELEGMWTVASTGSGPLPTGATFAFKLEGDQLGVEPVTGCEGAATGQGILRGDQLELEGTVVAAGAGTCAFEEYEVYGSTDLKYDGGFLVNLCQGDIGATSCSTLIRSGP